MPSSFAKLTNSVFKFLIIFCLSFIWINFYYHKFFLSVIFSLIISSAICAILTIFDAKKQNKTKLKLNLVKKANIALTQLKFYSYIESVNFVSTMLNMLNYNPQKQKEYVVVNNTLIIPCFNKNLNEETFINFYNLFKQTDYKKLIIMCVAFDGAFETFVSNFNLKNVEFVCGEQLYINFIEPSEIKIENKIELKGTKKLKLAEIKNVIFNKSRAKGYFFSGLILLFTSIFYPYGLYYQIFSSLLFALSLFSFYNKKFNPVTTKTYFE